MFAMSRLVYTLHDGIDKNHVYLRVGFSVVQQQEVSDSVSFSRILAKTNVSGKNPNTTTLDVVIEIISAISIDAKRASSGWKILHSRVSDPSITNTLDVCKGDTGQHILTTPKQ